MLWLWFVVVLSTASAEDFCVDFEPEIDDTIQAMSRIMEVFYGSLYSVTADVALGLTITNIILEKIPESSKWTNEINKIHQDCQNLIDGYKGGKFGDHKSSQNLIPYMLNTKLWQKIIKDPSNMDYSSTSLHFQKNHFSLNAELSDECFGNLFTRNCNVNPACFVGNTKSAFNFETTHYLLFLQIAGALDCNDGNFFTASKLQICRKMYGDIFSKKLKNSAALDVMLEGLVVCGIEGFDPFTSREIQRYVKNFEVNGCFRVVYKPKSRNKKTDVLTVNKCHSHTNAVGFTALALFLKSLIEKCELNKNF